jgi:hypothetical protein
MKRKSKMRFAQHGGTARTIAVVMYCGWRYMLAVLMMLGSVLVLQPVKDFAQAQLRMATATMAMSAAAAPLTGHLDMALTNFAKGYTQNELVSDILCPRVPVGRQTDKYWIHGREGQQLTEKTKRAPGAPARRTRLTLSSDSYFADSHALASEIPVEQQAAYSLVGDLRQDATQDLMSKILLDKEVATQALLTDTTVLTTNTTLAGTSQWSDGANSDPLGDVETARQSVMLTGSTPNLMIITPAVLKALKNHPAVRDAFKYTTPGSIGIPQLQAFFMIDRIILAASVQLDKAGAASFVWGKDVVIAYLSPGPGQRDISVAKTFVWAGAPGTVDGFGTVVAPHPDPTAKSEIVGVDFYYAIKVTAPEAGYLIKSAVA